VSDYIGKSKDTLCANMKYLTIDNKCSPDKETTIGGWPKICSSDSDC